MPNRDRKDGNTNILYFILLPGTIFISEGANMKALYATILIIPILSVGFSFHAEASQSSRYTSKPNTVFCRSLSTMRTLQSGVSKNKASSLLTSGECIVATAEVTVDIVKEEKDLVRVQWAGSGEYYWTLKKDLR